MSDFSSLMLSLMAEKKMSYGALSTATGIPKSALQRYATGESRIPADRLGLIASALGCSLSRFMGGEDEKIVPFPAAARDIDPIYDALNQAGQAELCRYGAYLGTQEQYKAAERKGAVRYIRHYLTAAAAGYAAPIEGEDYELVPCGADTPLNADFSIEIAGDSMEPYIKNGQTVYVQRDVSLKEFEAGIFFVDGDVYCKQWCLDYNGTLHLLSANPKREDANISVPRDSGRSVIFFGKVLIPKLPPPIYR